MQLIVNLVDMNDNFPTFPLSQYIVQGIAETVAVGTDIIQGLLALIYRICCIFVLTFSLRFNGHFPGEPGLAGVY